MKLFSELSKKWGDTGIPLYAAFIYMKN